MDLDSVFNFVVTIAKQRAAWINALCGPFLHALLDFHTQVLNVAVSNGNLKAIH